VCVCVRRAKAFLKCALTLTPIPSAQQKARDEEGFSTGGVGSLIERNPSCRYCEDHDDGAV